MRLRNLLCQAVGSEDIVDLQPVWDSVLMKECFSKDFWDKWPGSIKWHHDYLRLVAMMQAASVHVLRQQPKYKHLAGEDPSPESMASWVKELPEFLNTFVPGPHNIATRESYAANFLTRCQKMIDDNYSTGFQSVAQAIKQYGESGSLSAETKNALLLKIPSKHPLKALTTFWLEARP